MFRQNHHAFTLVELLITLSLISILGLIATPNLTHLFEQNRIYALRDQLKAHLHLARVNSVFHNRDIELCGSSDGKLCDDQWQRGWIVRFVSNNQIIHQIQLSSQDRIAWAGASHKIRFHSNGTSPLGNGRFYICDKNQAVALQIVINRQGRVRQTSGLEAGQDQSIKCK